MTRILVLFHSKTGHVARLAAAVAEGAAGVDRCTVDLRRVPDPAAADPVAETAPATPDMVAGYDGLAIGTPVHFGAPSAAVAGFLAGTGRDWMDGTLIGKPATVFAAGGSGGGMETAIIGLWASLATHGMTLVPPGNRAPEAADLSAANGAGPYGAGTLSSAPGDRPDANERAAALAQGRALAEVARAWKERR